MSSKARLGFGAARSHGTRVLECTARGRADSVCFRSRPSPPRGVRVLSPHRRHCTRTTSGTVASRPSTILSARGPIGDGSRASHNIAGLAAHGVVPPPFMKPTEHCSQSAKRRHSTLGVMVRRLLQWALMVCPDLDGHGDTPRAPPITAPDAEFWQNFFAHRKICFIMCVRWLHGNRHDAEDALSRGALRALDYHRRHPERIGNFRPWMLRLLHNLCADIREAQARLIGLPNEEDEGAPELASPGLTPDRALYARELRGILDCAVTALPPWLHTIFCLRLIDAVPYPELCRQFQISPENARQRIQQARRRLRSQLVDHL